MDFTLKKNDVAVVLRPIIEDGFEWDGAFQMIVTVAGPVELDEEYMKSLLVVASYLCAAVPLMQESARFTELLRDKADTMMGDVLIGDSMVPLLNKNTKCEGGVQ